MKKNPEVIKNEKRNKRIFDIVRKIKALFLSEDVGEHDCLNIVGTMFFMGALSSGVEKEDFLKQCEFAWNHYKEQEE